MINLVSEMEEISVTEPREGTLGTAFVLESFKDQSKGNVSTIIVTEGKFTSDNFITYMNEEEELGCEGIKGLFDERGEAKQEVTQGHSARIIGLSEILKLGQVVYCVDEKDDADIEIFETHKKEVEEKMTDQEEMEGDDLLAAVLSQGEDEEEELEKLNIVLKTDSQGTLQAIENSLEGVNEEGLIVEVIKSGVGNVHVNDVEYAQNLSAIVIGFGVEIDKAARDHARKSKVLIRTYDLIYDLVDELEDAAIAMQAPEEVEEVSGEAEVRQIFTLSNGTRVVGVRITEGEIRHGLQCKIMRKGNEVGRGKITSMQHGKEKVTSTGRGNECGLVIDSKEEIEEGDTIICYRIVKK
jgi:translation initiation factor IF-2